MDALQQAYQIAKDNQKAWSLPFDSIDPAAADDYFFYFRNNGAKPVVVYQVNAESTVVGTVELHHVSGVEGGSPTARTPVNKNLGAGPMPQIGLTTGTLGFHYDDPDITGLTDEGVLLLALT